MTAVYGILPHHGVYHPKKPDKIRVVYDCSAEYQGTSLNKQLYQGPNLTNNLVGVLTRFRQEKVAFMTDVEAMFHQVRVPESDCDLFRFLWWLGGDVDQEIQEYQMTVHLFGVRHRQVGRTLPYAEPPKTTMRVAILQLLTQ